MELVIASEVFELHGRVGSRLKKVALAAAKKWAGAEQTASGLLVTYLQKNVQAYKSFVVRLSQGTSTGRTGAAHGSSF